ncbi:hypothetical protein L3X38_011767 [Prunus dulcis]|uniref:Uncharacterized protein n=1 Tax=Prunus dulcis TaxID=3755 RepID=A0AAD4WKG3_PRUDU|nr:hypothetical protein L3X38_011767 [Prunus dulcis]
MSQSDSKYEQNSPAFDEESSDDKHGTEYDKGSDSEVPVDNGMIAEDGPTRDANLEVPADDVMATENNPNEDADAIQ